MMSTPHLHHDGDGADAPSFRVRRQLARNLRRMVGALICLSGSLVLAGQAASVFVP